MLSTAIILPGSESPVADGSTGAVRCTLLLPDATRRAAVVKRGPLGQVAAEAFSALLLRGWGLPVPQPFIVEDASTLAFGSADVGYPNLRKRLALDALPAGPARDTAMSIGCLLASTLPSAGLAAAADEAIENVDRNLGNILWDGRAEFWIDHAYALGQGPGHLGAVNKLCVMAAAAGTHEGMSASAVAQALALDRTQPEAAEGQLPPALRLAFGARVAARLGSLASMLLARFPQPRDLLSAP